MFNTHIGTSPLSRLRIGVRRGLVFYRLGYARLPRTFLRETTRSGVERVGNGRRVHHDGARALLNVKTRTFHTLARAHTFITRSVRIVLKTRNVQDETGRAEENSVSVAGAQRVRDGADDRPQPGVKHAVRAHVQHVGPTRRARSGRPAERRGVRDARPGPLPGRGRHPVQGAGSQTGHVGPVRAAERWPTHARAERVPARSRRVAVRQGAGSVHGRAVHEQGGPVLDRRRPGARLGVVSADRFRRTRRRASFVRFGTEIVYRAGEKYTFRRRRRGWFSFRSDGP